MKFQNHPKIDLKQMKNTVNELADLIQMTLLLFLPTADLIAEKAIFVLDNRELIELEEK